MRRLLPVAVALICALVAMRAPSPVSPDEPANPPFGPALRYVGRDPLTGLPTRVDDRFIAASERAIETYGRDRVGAVPPPPRAPGEADIVTLSIPAIGITEAPVQRLGLDEFGRLDVPQDTATIGWHPAYANLPGSGGATFLAAHVEYLGRPGVFARLAALPPGETVTLRLSDGTSHRYRVLSTVDWPLAVIDMGALLRGLEGRESVVLMTCSGPANEGEYAFRTVVIAERAPSE